MTGGVNSTSTVSNVQASYNGVSLTCLEMSNTNVQSQAILRVGMFSASQQLSEPITQLNYGGYIYSVQIHFSVQTVGTIYTQVAQPPPCSPILSCSAFSCIILYSLLPS